MGFFKKINIFFILFYLSIFIYIQYYCAFLVFFFNLKGIMFFYFIFPFQYK